MIRRAKRPALAPTLWSRLLGLFRQKNSHIFLTNKTSLLQCNLLQIRYLSVFAVGEEALYLFQGIS